MQGSDLRDWTLFEPSSLRTSITSMYDNSHNSSLTPLSARPSARSQTVGPTYTFVPLELPIGTIYLYIPDEAQTLLALPDLARQALWNAIKNWFSDFARPIRERAISSLIEPGRRRSTEKPIRFSTLSERFSFTCACRHEPSARHRSGARPALQLTTAPLSRHSHRPASRTCPGRGMGSEQRRCAVPKPRSVR